MVDIVLVHGTTQTAAGFDALVGELAACGHRAIAVSVPSAGAETAVGYADLLAAQVTADIDRPVVLGHSASGLLLPALSRRLRARHQIWLAAAVADYSGRRSFLAEVREDPGRVAQPEWLGVDPATDPVMATYFLFHDADLAALRAALATVAACDLTAVYAEIPTLDPAAIPRPTCSQSTIALCDRAGWSTLPASASRSNLFASRAATTATRARPPSPHKRLSMPAEPTPDRCWTGLVLGLRRTHTPVR